MTKGIFDYSRRDFIKASLGIAGLAFISGSDDARKKPLLSFSTLGCPDWSYPDIVNFAAANGYNGIEIRGLQRELDLPKCREFSTHQNSIASAKLTKEKGIKIIALGSSAQLHHSAAGERMKNLDEAKRFIDLANQLDCPYVRVFPNNFPKETGREASIDLITEGLNELGNYAKGTNTCVLMETHGDLVWSSDLETIMKAVEHSNTGLVWDIYNMWEVTKEPPAPVYKKLKKYIRHTHIKDGKTVEGKLQYTLLGKGESPIFEGIDTLYDRGYNGYYSFEWEKMWFPLLEEPEVALADYTRVMKQHFNKH